MTIHWQDLNTAGKIEAIKAVYQPGDSTRKIAESLGIGKNAVVGMYFRYTDDLADCPLKKPNKGGRPKGSGNPQAIPKPSPWPQEKRAAVAEMLRDGWTSRKIGAELGVTHNSVISLVRRDPVLAEIGFQSAIGRPKGRSGRPMRYVAIGLPISTVGRPLFDLKARECRWPVNEAEPGELHLFCAMPTERTYCEHHATRAVGSST